MSLADLSLPCTMGTGTPQAPCDAPGCPPCRGRRILRAVSDSRVRGDYQAAHQGRPPPHCREHDSHTGACNACVSALAAPRATRKVDPMGVPSEYDEQRALVKWLRARAIPHVASVNGAHLAGDNIARAKSWARLQASGATVGWPDLTIVGIPAGGWTIPGSPRMVCVELKRQRPAGRQPDAAQLACHATVRSNHGIVGVCYGAAEAIAWLESIGRW